MLVREDIPEQAERTILYSWHASSIIRPAYAASPHASQLPVQSCRSEYPVHQMNTITLAKLKTAQMILWFLSDAMLMIPL